MGAQNPQNIGQQNLLARAMLLQTGLHMIKQLQPVSAALGQSVRVPLERMGIMTGVVLDITVPVSVTVAATQSDFGPYPIVNNISYTDYAGLQRVNTHGFLLHMLNDFKTLHTVNNATNNASILAGMEAAINTNILSHPTAVADGFINFSLYVPMAYDPANDLRGAVLAQTIYGDHYLTLKIADALVGADELMSPYSAGTAAITAGQQITVQAYQHYIMPQGGVDNLPMVDLSTIYAVEGNYNDSANIVAGQAKYVNWPNNRAIMSASHIFNNGGQGTLNETDVSRIILLGNSNTNIREMSPRYLRNQMRYALGSDMPKGTYYIPSRAQPITTQLYGNVQSRFDIATANAGAYFLSQYESVYLSGTPLPGVVQ
jgi:hypothetical protein